MFKSTLTVFIAACLFTAAGGASSQQNDPLSASVSSDTGTAPITLLPDNFEEGGISIYCENQCIGSWAIAKDQVKVLIDTHRWQEAVDLVVRTAPNRPLPYYYLAKSAEGLGLLSAARRYYEIARVQSYNTVDGCLKNFAGCDGVNVGREANLAFERLPELAPVRSQVNVPSYIWASLTETQRVVLRKQRRVVIMESASYGTIVDAQSQNESTGPNLAGSSLGSTFGSATYVDNSIRKGTYSAVGQVTASIIGGIIGSSFDKPGNPRFRTRYTVKTVKGSIEYVEDISGDSFRHSIGLCVGLTPFRLLDLDVCGETLDQFFSKYVALIAPENGQLAPPVASGASTAFEVYCKFATVPIPVKLPKTVCESAGGAVLQ